MRLHAALLALALATSIGLAREDPPKPAAEPVRPGSRVDARTALEGGVAFLVAHQNKDGSWGSHLSARPYEVLASVPGSQEAFLVATSALCLMALADSGIVSPAVGAAREKGVRFLVDNCAVKRQSALEHYNVWSFGYGLQALAEELARAPEGPHAKELRAACTKLVERLSVYQTTDGGWGYLSMNDVPTYKPSDTSMSFTTATILVGVQRAAALGIEIPKKMRDDAIDNLNRSKLPDGAFLYGDYLKYRPRLGVNERKGSACRTPACLYALDLLGQKVTREEYTAALEDLLFKHAAFQRAGVREPTPHKSWYQISGYFYLYGHAYAAYVMDRLPLEDRARFGARIVEAVLYCREPDGSFWDYPLYGYHDAYGTAYAVLALSRVPGVKR